MEQRRACALDVSTMNMATKTRCFFFSFQNKLHSLCFYRNETGREDLRALKTMFSLLMGRDVFFFVLVFTNIIYNVRHVYVIFSISLVNLLLRTKVDRN